MIDPELKAQLEEISDILEKTRKRSGLWRSLAHGLLSGFGSVFGFVIAIVALGWALNAIGVIPAFRREVDDWRKLLQQTQQQKLPNVKAIPPGK